MVCCERRNRLRHRDPRTIPGCRCGSLAGRPRSAARRIAVELAPSSRDRERRRTAGFRRRAGTQRRHLVSPPRSAASPRRRDLARRADGRYARGDIVYGDDGWSFGAASAAPARHRASRSFHLAPVLRFVSCRRSRSLFSAVMATGVADFLLPAWLWSAGPMSRLPQRNSAVRSDGPDPAICLRALRFRLARGRQEIGRGGCTAVGTVDRRYLQGGNRQEFVGDPRMGRAPAARSSRRRRRFRSAARQPVGVDPHPLLRAARAKGRRWAHRCRVRPAPSTNSSRRRP